MNRIRRLALLFALLLTAPIAAGCPGSKDDPEPTPSPGHGGYPAAGLFLGYAIVVTQGDAEALGMSSFIANFRSNPNEVAVFTFEPEELPAIL